MSASVCASSASSSAARMAAANDAGWDSDGSLSWEDFFGTSTDLVPTLLGMYDSLVGRGAGAAAADSPRGRRRAPPPPPPHAPPPQPPPPPSPRPLSVSSIASSSSSASSSGASSCGGRGAAAGGACGGGARGRLGAGAARAEASCAYLASIESLDDASDDDAGGRSRCGGAAASQGGGAGAALPYAQRVVAEVLESERVYVRDLRQVVEGYLRCWQTQSDSPLTEQQLADLFSNIEEIYEFNSAFLRELERCGADPVRVARCFVAHDAGFRTYTHYCTHYPRTVRALTDLMRRDAAARLFRERQTALQHALSLGSFLLKPVQRILKYHLLLQNIVKHLDPDTEGRADVVDALSTMTGIAHHINSMKRRHEHAVRVQEIQSLLYGWEGEDLTTFGELCAEGAFRLAGAKALRHAFLFDRMLLITKKKEEGVLSYKAHILCSNLMLIESVPGEPLSFHVIPFDNPRLQYTLRARNLEQKREWALQLKRVILENYNAVIPSHARRLVMELGQHRTDDEILADKTPPRRQHSAPEYLEKRKQERERRKSETGLRHRLRRQRKSDIGLSGGEQSPSSPRRYRRASSSSRERSHSRDGLRSVSPAAIKERFGSWRRKSEPGCYSSGADSKSDISPKLTLLPERASSPPDVQHTDETQASEKETPLVSEPLESPSSSPSSTIGNSAREGPPSSSRGSCTDYSESQTTGQRSLEEIVGQLLLQNHEFQKMLRRQQRRQQMRLHAHHRNVGNSLTAETSDTETEADDGAYESLTLPVTLTPPTKSKMEQYLHQEDEEQESDYVTLAVPNTGPSSSRRSGDYDNLQQIWESVRRQQEEIRRLAEREGVIERDCDESHDRENHSSLACDSIPIPSLRRAQSFCTSTATSTPCSSAFSTTTTAASLETLDTAPTAPAVWLRQQGAHLATPSKKSGSLPRSFQLAHSFGTAAAILAGTGRPFTIASDPPAEINFEDIEHYMAQAAANGSGARHAFPVAPTSPAAVGAGDTTEDESLPEAATPAASLRELNVHPEHKIYRPAAARAALRQVVVNVSARLTAGLRASTEALDDTSNDNIQQNGSGNASSESQHVSRRFMSALRHYSKTRLRLHSFVGEESTAASRETPPAAAAAMHRSPPPPTPPPPPPSMVDTQQLPIYKQGSSRLGARIALCSSDYANPQQLLSHLPSRQPDVRPDSVLSASSAFTSSSDGERPPPLSSGPVSEASAPAAVNGTREDLPLSDGSADSYYERSFEAIEALLENDVFRDSAVFSDHDDDPPEPLAPASKNCSHKVPPPVPAKPDTLKCRFIHVAVPTHADVRKKSRVLAETAARSVAARSNKQMSSAGSEVNGVSRGRPQRPTRLLNTKSRCSLEEEWESREKSGSSQLSTPSTVVEVASTPQHMLSDDENSMQQKGWVKHVIGKLQGLPNPEGQNGRKIASSIYSEVGDSV